MNTSWMVLVDGRGSWMLVEVYTRRLTPLPSINTALLWHRGPEYSEPYSSQHDTKFDLLKVVICEVPTPSEDYMDYKHIAVFNMGLVYLESGRHTWLWLIINPVEATFLSDAIVHDGIVYAVDAQIGCLYWWNLSSCNCSISSHLYLKNTTACSLLQI